MFRRSSRHAAAARVDLGGISVLAEMVAMPRSLKLCSTSSSITMARSPLTDVQLVSGPASHFYPVSLFDRPRLPSSGESAKRRRTSPGSSNKNK